MTPRSKTPPARRDRRAGSAYVIALLAIVVLTLLGLALALITQSEVQIGATERTVQRVFYAADSGIASSTARAIVKADYAGMIYEVPESDTVPALNLREEIDVSAFYPILRAPCNLCEINDAGIYGKKQYFKINHAVTTTGSRRGGTTTDTLAQKTLSAIVEIQPQENPVEALLAVVDPAQLERIKF